MIALHSGNVVLKSGKASCSCCSYPAYFPTLTRLTCGFNLSKTNFPSAVRSGIPDEAAAMYWRRFIHFESRTGEEQLDDLCNESTWATRRTASEEGSYYYEIFGSGCVYSKSCGGFGERTEQTRANPCGDPPDNTLTWDESRFYDMRAAENIWDWTGTENGTPISGSSLGGQLVPIIPLGLPYPDYTNSLTLGTSPASVVCDRSREWDFTDGYSKTAGHDSYRLGYEDPDDYRLEVTMDGTLPFAQFRLPVYFAEPGDPPSLVDTIAIDWNTGDPLTQIFAYPYESIGTYSLGPACIRHNPSHPYTCASP